MIQNKHVVRLSFIGLFINIIANLLIYRYFMIEEVVMRQISDQNVQLAKLYKDKIWYPYKESTILLKKSNLESLINDQNFINFIKKSSKFFKETDNQISLYDGNGKKFIESNDNSIIDIEYNSSNSLYNKLILSLDRYFLSSYFIETPLQFTLKGQTQHFLISRAILTDKDNIQSEKSLIISYIPIIDSSNGNFNIEGIIKITTDVTAQWDNIAYLEKSMIFSFFGVFLIFFIIIMYNTHHAQRIINKQFESNRELKEAKIKAETDNSAKTEFLANISHELRTPLNAIIGFSEIILSENNDNLKNKQHHGYISDINNSGKHLLSVINDILDFSKASTEKLQVESIELDLNKLAASSMRFVKPRADSANVKLIEKLPKEHIVIKADPKRLKQALLNLLSNSVKFTPSDGSVTISIKKNELKKIVYVKVTDTGIGMSDKEIPKALSSFGQVDNKLSRKYEGTGLGLPLTKKLVELMDGKFEIQSEPGKGTEVTLTFSYSEIVW